MTSELQNIKTGINNAYSEINKYETDLKNLNKTLEEKVKQRTTELEKQKDIVEQATKSKSEFLANMSHEIRTPLNAIVGFIDILKEENKGRKSLEYINIIDKSSKSLLIIINDILDFSKIESGKLNIEKIYFNPVDEFTIIIDLFKGKCSKKNISLNVNIDKDIPNVIKTDPLRIKQVISNLLSNAIKFTESGKKIYIDISYKNNLLKIFVKDEGKGIASDKLGHIFEAFNQEDNSTTRQYGGTGLGLAISSELVKLLGGELKVKSELGKGSEFYFCVPAEKEKEIKKIEKTSNQHVVFGGEKILVVEDNKSNQMLMKVLLEKINFSFDFADDGLIAVEMYKENKYDAILMDENMPNMNGMEATRQILKYEQENNLKHTPIIALTANALKGDRERFLKAGMDEYLTKPINKEKLIQTLNRLL